MKNIFVLIIIIASLTSCTKEEFFSCDPEIDAWVKENIVDIQQMTRGDWLQLDEGVNRAVYAAFTPEQKQEFWLQKLQEVLSLDWNESEKNHINVLHQALLDNPQWFSANFHKEEDFEAFEIFAYKWVEYSKDDLGWGEELIGATVFTGNKLLDVAGSIQINTVTTVRLKNGVEVSCNCNTSHGNLYNECKSNFKHCSTQSPCKERSWGCGIEKCDGLCKNN
jgi:hypothetical protein